MTPSQLHLLRLSDAAEDEVENPRVVRERMRRARLAIAAGRKPHVWGRQRKIIRLRRPMFIPEIPIDDLK